MSTDRLGMRRLDLQLTGRVGRQGDPADCQFFLCLKDDLLRYSDRKKVFKVRRRTRTIRSKPLETPHAIGIFESIQKKLDKLSSRRRQQIFRQEKQKEKMKQQGLWEDWMDIR